MNSKISNYIFSIVACLFSYVCFFLFYCQIHSEKDFLSDLKSHLKFSTINENGQVIGYSLMHNLVDFTAQKISHIIFVDYQTAAMLILLILLSLAILSTIFLINYFFEFDSSVKANQIQLAILSFTSMVVAMIIVTPLGGNNFVYLGTGTPNPWHNPTYLISRPFAILTFIFSIILLKQAIDNKIEWLKVMLLSLSAMFCMWFKPSFLISFLPALAITLLWLWYKGQVKFKQLIIFGLIVIPALLVMMYINHLVYENASASQIKFAIGDFWKQHNKPVIVSILLGTLFPLYVLIISRKELKLDFVLASINYLLAFLIVFFMTETGIRAEHGNFFWTYMFAMFFMFLVATKYFFIQNKYPFTLKIIGSIFYGAHLISGIIYFLHIL